MTRYRLFAFTIILLVALSIWGIFQAYWNPTVTYSSIQQLFNKEIDTSPHQKLQFSVVEAEIPGYTHVCTDELGANTDTYIVYSNLAEVNIVLDQITVALPEIILNRTLTTPEIFALARIDAMNGFCKESYVSKLGLSHFIYTYPECELWIAYDVYETPSGTQELIDEIYIHSVKSSRQYIDFIYTDKSSEWGYFVDREDWGLSFEVTSVSPTYITVNYTQQQSQEIGELRLEDYTLFSMDNVTTSDTDPKYLFRSKSTTDGLPVSIQSDSSGQITIDLSDTGVNMKSGMYYLRVTVSDNYSESDLHPLMLNYYDRQSYHIAFTIA